MRLGLVLTAAALFSTFGCPTGTAIDPHDVSICLRFENAVEREEYLSTNEEGRVLDGQLVALSERFDYANVDCRGAGVTTEFVAESGPRIQLGFEPQNGSEIGLPTSGNVTLFHYSADNLPWSSTAFAAHESEKLLFAVEESAQLRLQEQISLPFGVSRGETVGEVFEGDCDRYKRSMIDFRSDSGDFVSIAVGDVSLLRTSFGGYEVRVFEAYETTEAPSDSCSDAVPAFASWSAVIVE